MTTFEASLTSLEPSMGISSHCKLSKLRQQMAIKVNNSDSEISGPHDPSDVPFAAATVQSKHKGKKAPFKLPTNDEQLEELIKTLVWRHKNIGRGTRPGYVGNYPRPWRTREARALDALNPWSSEIWASYLYAATKDHGAENFDWRFITVCDQDWDFDRDEASNPKSSFASFIEKQGRILRDWFRGFDFIFFAELAPHRIARKFTHVFCHHWHGIVLGNDAKLNKIAKAFGEGSDGAPGCVVLSLEDEKGGLEGLFEYVTKDPRAQYVTFAKRGTRKVLHRPEKLTRSNHSLLIDHYYEYAKPELAIASGLGSKILRRAIAKAKAAGYREYEGERRLRGAL